VHGPSIKASNTIDDVKAQIQAMPSRKNKKPPSGKSLENAAERKAWASESAVSFVTGAVMDANTIAVQCIERMLMEMYLVFSWLVENGYSRDRFAMSTHGFAQLKYCLSAVTPSQTIAAVEALHGFWLHDGALTHDFMAAGLQDVAKEVFRTVYDAIAMSTILFPETYQHIFDMGIEVELLSRLQHAHFIAKRYLCGVGEVLAQMGEVPVNCVTKKQLKKADEATARARDCADQATARGRKSSRAKDWLDEATLALLARASSED
jgi:hypothetical protein